MPNKNHVKLVESALLSAKSPLTYKQISSMSGVELEYTRRIVSSLTSKYNIKRERKADKRKSSVACTRVSIVSLKKNTTPKTKNSTNYISIEDTNKIRRILNGAELRITKILSKKCSLTLDVDKEKMYIEMRLIVSVVCTFLDIKEYAVYSRSRRKEIVWARHLCAYFAKELTNMSLTEIGSKLDRDHSTIINSISTIKNDIAIYPSKAKKINNIKRYIYAEVEMNSHYKNSFLSKIS